MRIKSATALIGLGLTLAACGPANRGLESIHQPVVQRTDYVLDVAGGGYDGLATGEAQRLGDWFQSIDLRYGDRVSIDDPSGYADGTRAAVAEVAARYGLLLERTAPITQGDIPQGAVRVVVSRAIANVPNCPRWDRPANIDFEGAGTPNYGCASNSNLAAMVANPEDLVVGRNSTGVDAAVTARALKAYRDTEPSGAGGKLKLESTQGGGK